VTTQLSDNARGTTLAGLNECTGVADRLGSDSEHHGVLLPLLLPRPLTGLTVHISKAFRISINPPRFKWDNSTVLSSFSGSLHTFNAHRLTMSLLGRGTVIIVMTDVSAAPLAGNCCLLYSEGTMLPVSIGSDVCRNMFASFKSGG